MKKMIKVQAMQEFRIIHEEDIKKANETRDKVMINTLWHQYTDLLCKEGKITLKQYETWTTPEILKSKNYLENWNKGEK